MKMRTIVIGGGEEEEERPGRWHGSGIEYLPSTHKALGSIPRGGGEEG
jgi:hypothetical protein